MRQRFQKYIIILLRHLCFFLFQDVLIASAVTSLLNDIESSDFSNWADSGSEFSSDESSDFVLSDPELQGDVWKCVKCSQPNTPYMRYCHRCWEVSVINFFNDFN